MEAASLQHATGHGTDARVDFDREDVRGQDLAPAAAERGADCIVMATEGRHGMLEVMRGSTTTKVLQHAPCALAALPAHVFAAPAE